MSSLFNTPEEARAWIRKIMGPPTRRLEGKEHEQMMLLFSMTEPVRETNNQHSWCAEYNIGGKMYNVHYFPDEEPFIDLILEEVK